MFDGRILAEKVTFISYPISHSCNLVLTVQGEEGGEGLFPHLYNGGRLGHNEIETIRHWHQEDNKWDAALAENNTWLD